VPTAAQDLGLEAARLYASRSKAGQQGQDAEAQRLMQSEQARFTREVARLEEEVPFLKRAAACFTKQPKRGTR
jgi:transposase-like protein